MKPAQFLAKLDDEKIVAAIKAAESASSGEIRVFVAEEKVVNPLAEARKQFRRLKMERTRDRNAVLIYFAPLTHEFAVVGDAGIHARCGSQFWTGLTADMSQFLRTDRFTEAVVMAVDTVGKVLARHFPRKPDDTDELPDSVIRG